MSGKQITAPVMEITLRSNLVYISINFELKEILFSLKFILKSYHY